MNTTQNTKISQIKEDTLIVGVDIGSTTHYARAFNWRGIEFGKVYKFSNCRDQFDRFQRWMRKISDESGMNNILVGVEPTDITGSILAYILSQLVSSYAW